MPKITCPFCLESHDFTQPCPVSKLIVPEPYVKQFNKVRPLWLLTVGFPEHGKTTYLAMLTLLLQRDLPRIWDVSYRALGQHTIDQIQEMRANAGANQTAPSTQQMPPPLLLSINGLPHVGSRCLVIYDVPGEYYMRIDSTQQQVKAIRDVRSVWFLVSLSDLTAKGNSKTISDLFDIYSAAMGNVRAELKGRNLIVVYTKADKLLNTKEIKQDLETYFDEDPLPKLRAPGAEPSRTPLIFDDYVAGMRRMSNILEDYTRSHVETGPAFIRNVRIEHGMNLVFCAVSAIGSSPTPGSRDIIGGARPLRVLDPFLWTLALEQPHAMRSFGLVLDASQGSEVLYANSLVADIWQDLTERGDVTVYHLGQSRPIGAVNTVPPSAPPRRRRQRLIGPILESISDSEMYLLVLSNGPITDLSDFYHTQWRERLLLATLNEDPFQTWSHSVSRQPDNANVSLATVLTDSVLQLVDNNPHDHL